jgi:hypothetical protein
MSVPPRAAFPLVRELRLLGTLIAILAVEVLACGINPEQGFINPNTLEQVARALNLHLGKGIFSGTSKQGLYTRFEVAPTTKRWLRAGAPACGSSFFDNQL